MQIKYTTRLFIFLFIASIFSTCKKYPEDDSCIHLRTVEGRLSRSWSSGYFNMVISRNGTIKGTFDGEWMLTDKKKKILITGAIPGKIFEFTIKKLDPKELWLENDTLLIKFEPWEI